MPHCIADFRSAYHGTSKIAPASTAELGEYDWMASLPFPQRFYPGVLLYVRTVEYRSIVVRAAALPPALWSTRHRHPCHNTAPDA